MDAQRIWGDVVIDGVEVKQKQAFLLSAEGSSWRAVCVLPDDAESARFVAAVTKGGDIVLVFEEGQRGSVVYTDLKDKPRGKAGTALAFIGEWSRA